MFHKTRHVEYYFRELVPHAFLNYSLSLCLSSSTHWRAQVLQLRTPCLSSNQPAAQQAILIVFPPLSPLGLLTPDVALSHYNTAVNLTHITFSPLGTNVPAKDICVLVDFKCTILETGFHKQGSSIKVPHAGQWNKNKLVFKICHRWAESPKHLTICTQFPWKWNVL